mmetsp:Transcript_17494/g.29324  ORF Transcript_17494/g.29324 Transcript_17494/m.29324 type:complete len:403 (+) Transcript_17494:55-1263(+)
MGAGSSAAYPFSPATIDVYSTLPPRLTREQCEEVVGKESSDLLWSRYMGSHTVSSDLGGDGNGDGNGESLIKRERLLNLSVVGKRNQRKERNYKNVLPDIMLLNFKFFKARGEIPRFSKESSGLVNIDKIDKSKVFIVFISHMWLRSKPNVEHQDGFTSHPDTPDNSHYHLCVDGIERIRHNHVRNIEDCYVWIDYSCLNQTINPVQDIEELDTIISACDCIFTPLIATLDEVEPVHEVDIMPETSSTMATVEGYRMTAWSQFLRRSWCRLEMFYGSTIPISHSTMYKFLNKNFNMELHFAISQGRRPHFLYNSNHSVLSTNPSCLTSIPNTLFEKYHPRGGDVTNALDRVKIEQLVNDLQSYMTRVDETHHVGFKSAPNKNSKKKEKEIRKAGEGTIYIHY